MRRGSLLQLGFLVLIAIAISTAVALLIPWLPPPAGEEAGRIWFVYWFATVISIGVFAVVAAVLAYSIWKFRARPDDLSDGPPVHGHTGLEIVWTAIPFVLVTAIAIVSAIVLAQNSDAGAHPLRIKVVAQQFAWQFTYPNNATFGSLHLPKGRHVELTLTANDVIHSFWVPELAQKQDAVPGQTTKLVITPTRLGTFPVICTELCGLGHSLMRSEAVVMSEAAYEKWYASAGKQPAGGGNAGLATFNSVGCSACHTFTAAGATGKVGPSLDNLKAAAAKAGQPLDAFIKESIVDPDKEIAPGFHAGVMPTTFGSQIPADKLDQLVQYLAENQK